jgi:hypothetical protein
MADQYRATPEQWSNIEQLASSCIYDLVILELRDRLAAIEQRNQTPQDFTPPLNCSQRLQKEGKPYPKSDCNVCGQMSPMWRQCAAALDREAAANLSAGLRSSSHLVKPDSLVDPSADRRLAVHWSCPAGGCDICQRDWPCARLAAEQDARAGTNSKPTPNPGQIRSSATGDLMQSVGAAICSIADCGDTPLNWAPEARAAILAVAGWLEHRKPAALHCAALLREEVQQNRQD